MESVCENQNSPSSDIHSGIKGAVQEDGVNTSESEKYGQGDDIHDKAIEQNSCEENSKDTSGVVNYEASNLIGDGALGAETVNRTDKDKESEILDEEVEKELLGEENTNLMENESLENIEKGNGGSDVIKSGENEEDVRNDEASNALEESKDTENVASAHDQGSQEHMIADQDLQGEHSSLNEVTNMDVEEIGSVSNAEQDGSKEDEMNVDSKDKEASASEIPDKVIENDLEENLNQDDEVSMNPSEGNANPVAEEEMSMNVSDADGEHSGDGEDMQVDNSEKDGGETMDVTMTNVDLGAGGDESMEVASPNDQDPIRLMNDSDANKDNSSGEQMDVTESTEEGGKPDEIEDGVKNCEAKDSSKQAEHIDESTKEDGREDGIMNHEEGNEDNRAAKNKESEDTEGSGKLESAESRDDKEEDTESKDEEKSSEKGKVGEAADEAKSNSETEPADKEETDTAAGSGKNSSEAGGKEKHEEELCIIPDTVLRVGGKDDKPDEKDIQENTHEKSEKPAVTEVVEKPKPTRKSSSAEKKAESSYVAAVEPVVEYRHSRPQRQAAKRAETQIKVRLEVTLMVSRFEI
jgi:hypothetical protein